MQPTTISHRDRFEVVLTHLGKPLKAFDSLNSTGQPSPSATGNVEHTGDLTNFNNKVYALPLQKASSGSVTVQFRLLAGFDFLSGNAVRIGLRIETGNDETTNRPEQLIRRAIHETAQEQSASVFYWRVTIGEAVRGKFTVSLTRVDQDEEDDDKYSLLTGHEKHMYTLEVDWQVCGAAPNGTNTAGASSKGSAVDEMSSIPKTSHADSNPRPKKKAKESTPVKRPGKSTKNDTGLEIDPDLMKILSRGNLFQVFQKQRNATEFNDSKPAQTTRPLPGLPNAQKLPETALSGPATSSPTTPTPLPKPDAAPKNNMPSLPDVWEHRASSETDTHGLKHEASAAGFGQADEDDDDDVELLGFRLGDARANLKVVKIELKMMAKKKGISQNQDDGDDEYCNLQLHVAEVERDVANLEMKLKTAERRQARRTGGT